MMSVPALRQPKFISEEQEKRKKIIFPDMQYVILTLKNSRKLVVSSDAYHGIITAGDVYKCVFCCVVMELDSSYKEKHINSDGHRKMLETYPHVEEYSENLVRKLTEDTSFCTICNVVISNVQLMRHLATDVHTQELKKAAARSDIYKPY